VCKYAGSVGSCSCALLSYLHADVHRRATRLHVYLHVRRCSPTLSARHLLLLHHHESCLLDAVSENQHPDACDW
jgi:hypothetical protein